jgi:hypothetical protein
MLSFATEFPTKDCDTKAFIDCVRTWLEGSPHTKLPKTGLDDLPTWGRWQLRQETERVEALLSARAGEEIAAFKHVKIDDQIEWTTVVVFSKNPDSCWVGIRTSRESSQAQLGLPPAKKPFIVKTLLRDLGGGLDGELYVSDTPHNLKSNDLGTAARLLNGDADNYLPAVYISRTFDDRLLIDPLPLARELAGLAHVVVEPNREFSRRLQPDVASKNVYGGSAGVYWPNGQYYRYYLNEATPTEFDVRRLIASRLRASLLNRRPLARCTWARAEAEVARDAFEALRQSGSADVDEYIREFDAEIRAKDKQLEEAEEEIGRLKAQGRPHWTEPQGTSISLKTGSEREFIEGELLEIVLDALRTAADQVQADGRRQHVLRSLCEHGANATPLKERRDQLKAVLRQYSTMDRDTAKTLEALGFSISEDGKHYKLTYMGDERYVFTLPKSGSDHRGGLNAASDIGKRVY